MSIETRLREASDEIRIARSSAQFTVRPPHRGSFVVLPATLGLGLLAALVAALALLPSGQVEPVGNVEPPVGSPSYPGFDAALRGWPEPQRWALEDGLITADEVRVAFGTMLNCIRDAGYDQVHGRVDPGGGATWGVGGGGPSQGQDWLVVSDECERLYFQQIDAMYGWSRGTPWREQYPEDVSARIGLCVSIQLPEDKGVGYPDWDRAVAALGSNLAQVFAMCEQAVLEAAGH